MPTPLPWISPQVFAAQVPILRQISLHAQNDVSLAVLEHNKDGKLCRTMKHNGFWLCMATLTRRINSDIDCFANAQIIRFRTESNVGTRENNLVLECAASIGKGQRFHHFLSLFLFLIVEVFQWFGLVSELSL